MYRKIFISISIIFILIGCDIPGKIEIKNKLNEEVIIAYSFKDKNREPQSYKIGSNKEGYIMFGFGTKWNEKFIEYFPNQIIDTINLKIGNKEYFCENNKCKKQIFNKANRKNNKTMQIVIDPNLINESFTEK